MKILALTAILITIFVMLGYSLITFLNWKDNKRIVILIISILYLFGTILNIYVYIYVAINGLEKL